MSQSKRVTSLNLCSVYPNARISTSFWKICFILKCVCVCKCVHTYVRACMQVQCSWRPEAGVRSSGAGVTGPWEPPEVSAGNWTWFSARAGPDFNCWASLLVRPGPFWLWVYFVLNLAHTHGSQRPFCLIVVCFCYQIFFKIYIFFPIQILTI